MTDDTEFTDYDFGGAYGAQAAEEAAARRGGGFRRTDYFALDASEDGKAKGADQMLVRFLTDHVANPNKDPKEFDAYDLPWISVLQHTMVPTKPKPKDLDDDAPWPKSMPAVCRKDKVFARKFNNTCWICDNIKGKRPSSRTWALACRREEVYGTEQMVAEGLIQPNEVGQLLGVRDATKEIQKVDAEGKPIEGEFEVVKDILIINLGWKNFFAAMSGHAARKQTVLDRDYHIQRKGTGPSDTIYTPSPEDPIYLDDKGTKFDLRDRDLFKEHYPDLPDLRKIVAERCSDDFFKRFFIPGDDDSSSKASGPERPAASGSSQPSSGALASLQSRVMSYGKQEGGEQPKGEQQPAASGARRAL